MIVCIIGISSSTLQNANADIFDDMADLLKKTGTSSVCLFVIVIGVTSNVDTYPREACEGL